MKLVLQIALGVFLAHLARTLLLLMFAEASNQLQPGISRWTRVFRGFMGLY